MVIEQGDIIWAYLRNPSGSEPGFRHPVVIIQNDIFNRSHLATTIGIVLTSNIARAAYPGNVVLHKGEANLPKKSVANATHVLTIDKGELGEKIGKLAPHRLREILDGLQLVLAPKFL
jgi:mRNA interferase MazF